MNTVLWRVPGPAFATPLHSPTWILYMAVNGFGRLSVLHDDQIIITFISHECDVFITQCMLEFSVGHRSCQLFYLGI